MVMIRFRAQIATDPTTGMPRAELAGATGQIVQAGTTTVAPIWEDEAKAIVIPSSELTVTANSFTPQFWVEDTYELDWWDGANRVPIDSNAGTRDAAQDAAASAAVSADAAVAAQIAAEDAAAGGGGGGGGVTRHGALSDLDVDDHPQYHTNERGDARYYTKTQTVAAINTAVTSSSELDRDRTKHTGTQAISTVAGLSDALAVLLSSATIDTVWTGTQGAYAAISPTNGRTLYLVTGA